MRLCLCMTCDNCFKASQSFSGKIVHRHSKSSHSHFRPVSRLYLLLQAMAAKPGIQTIPKSFFWPASYYSRPLWSKFQPFTMDTNSPSPIKYRTILNKGHSHFTGPLSSGYFRPILSNICPILHLQTSASFPYHHHLLFRVMVHSAIWIQDYCSENSMAADAWYSGPHLLSHCS